jgi:hypothetical protein
MTVRLITGTDFFGKPKMAEQEYNEAECIAKAQGDVIVLMLNDMRAAQIENLSLVAFAESAEELEDFVRAELVPPYRDGHWGKMFRAGGPLEWFNPPDRFTGNLRRYTMGLVVVGSAGINMDPMRQEPATAS